MAEPLLAAAMQRYGVEELRVLATCRGADLEGVVLKHPFYAREVPVILGEHVTTEAGTGAVHTAPGHGQDDYVVGARYDLPVDNPVGPDGCFLPATELFAGEHVFKANDHVLEVLREHDALLHAETIQHSYPHCWRHKTPIIFRATPQWFIGMDQAGLRTSAMDAIKTVCWLPDWGQARIESMVANRPDWCISRQRTWGVPIALFVHRETGELHPDTQALIEQVAQRVEQHGIDAWFDLPVAELLGEDAAHYDKVTDTLDVWFDSGVTHATVLALREELQLPADLYLEGSDQHRGWFQSSLLTACGMRGEAPYKAVLTHGFTVDSKGHKMSKSRGNVVAPQKVMKNLGADVLRLWVAATDYRSEMTVSDEILKRTSDAYRRIRNTARFLLANLNGFEPARDTVPFDRLLMLDRWAVDRALQMQADIKAAYEDYQFHLIYQKVHNFCAVDMGSFYLDIIKDRQYTTRADSMARRSAQTAMYHIVEALVRWLAPVLSFTADEIWENIPGERGDSVFLETWYEDLVSLDKDAIMDSAYWEQLIELRQAVSKVLEELRKAGAIGSSLDAEVDLYCEAELRGQLELLEDELRFVLITSRARVHDIATRPGEAQDTDFPGLALRATASTDPKCVRCWHHRPDVGQVAAHPEICGRCVDNVTSGGESRRFA